MRCASAATCSCTACRLRSPNRSARAATGPEGYDGVAQLWWDSFEDMALADREAAAEAGGLLLEDERKFIDLPNSPLWWGEEKVIF